MSANDQKGTWPSLKSGTGARLRLASLGVFRFYLLLICGSARFFCGANRFGGAPYRHGNLLALGDGFAELRDGEVVNRVSVTPPGFRLNDAVEGRRRRN